MGKNQKILTALAAGVAIGVVAGMHIANKKKEEYPGNSPNEAEDLAGILKRKFEKGKEKLDDIGEAIIDIITEPRTRFE